MGKMPQKRMECFRLLFDHLAWIEHQFLSGIRDSRRAGSLRVDERCGRSKEVNTPELIGQTVRVRVSYYVEVLREFRKRFLGKRPELFKSSQWPFQQDNAPVNNSILVTDYLTKKGIKIVPQPPYSPDLAPCDFWLFPQTQRVSLWDNWVDERGCDEGHWHAHTRGLPWSHPEIFGTVQQVHCSRRRLVQRGLEFYVSTINKSAHTKKVWKLI